MSTPRGSFISLFFTHNVQQVQSDGVIQAWVDLTREIYLRYPETIDDNHIQLAISQNQPQGFISIHAPEAWDLLTTSNTDTIDSLYDIDTSATCYKIQAYNLQIQTPVYTRRSAVSYWRFQTQLDYSYPARRTSNSGSYIEQNIWCEPQRSSSRQLWSRLHLLPLDASLTTLQTNSTEFEYTPGNIISLDTSATDQYKLLSYNSDQIDSYPFYHYPTILNLRFIPYGTLTIDYIANKQLLSSFMLGNDLTYLPSSTLGKSMTLGNLEDIAYGLLALVSVGQVPLLTRTLKALVDIWAVNLNNLAFGESPYISIKGKGPLPSVLSKEFDYYQVPRDQTVYSISLLGLALVRVIKLFQSDKVDSRYQLPDYLDLLIYHHAYFVSTLVDSVGGWVVEGYFYNNISTNKDYAALPLVNLFLTEYLSIHYDPFIHERAARSYLHLKDILRNSIDEYNAFLTDVEVLRVIPSALLWANYYPALVPSNRIDELIQKYIATYPAHNSDAAKVCLPLFLYSTALLYNKPTKPNVSLAQWQYSNFFTQTNPTVYASISHLDDPTLGVSALGVLTESKFEIIKDRLFKLYAEEALLTEAIAYQQARQVWPFGYAWTSLDAEIARSGVLGSLLYAQAACYFSWGLLYHLYYSGLDITQAQGIALTYWYDSTGAQRSFGLSDQLLSQELQVRHVPRTSTFSAVQNYLKSLYDTTDLHIKHQVPKTLTYINSNGQYIEEVLDLSNPNHIDLILKAGNSRFHSQPGFISKPIVYGTAEPFVSWADLFPNLKVYTYTNCPNLAYEAQTVVSAGVGLETTLKLSFGVDQILQTQLFISSLRI